jgi:hypothetical protein
MPAMITDARKGKFPLSVPLRIIMKLSSIRGSDKSEEAA